MSFRTCALKVLAAAACVSTAALPSVAAVAATTTAAGLLPAEIGVGWTNGWVREWRRDIPGLKVEDFKSTPKKGISKVVRRWTWTGKETLEKVTLSVRYHMDGDPAALKPFIPGVLLYGNPSNKGRTDGRVPVYDGNPDEFAIFEEHRLPMPFVALESVECGDFVALHTLPSPVRGAVHPDQWWSAGVEARKDGADIVLLSGPVGYNRRRSVAKTRPQGWDDWGDAYIALKPGQSIEKTFWIQTGRATSDAFGFEQAVSASLDLFRPWTLVGRCASMDEILQVKHDYLMTRWIEENGACGFNKWDPSFDGTPGRQVIGLGWTKDTAGPAYALAVLNIRHGDRAMAQKTLDFVSDKFGPTIRKRNGTFCVSYNVKSQSLGGGDPVSVGQALYSIIKAVRFAKAHPDSGLRPAKWESFARKAAHEISVGVLKDNWTKPKATGAAFLVAPLVLSSEMYPDMPECLAAAQKLSDFYEREYFGYMKVYWGGSLDAKCEDKEGAQAAFQAYCAMLRHAIATKDKAAERKYARLARHAMNMYLSYTIVWDIPMPPGHLADAGFKSAGWTVVSAQNQCSDVFGLLTLPELWWMGDYLGDARLQPLSQLMYRSCFQLVDANGNVGEQILHTNYRHMWEDRRVIRDRGNARDFRGGYDPWNPIWLTGFFLATAADFMEMGVDLRLN